MARIVNPFAGYPVGYTWAQHKAAGLNGGTDYKVGPGLEVTAAVSGTASLAYDGLNSVNIRYALGRTITVRELQSTAGVFPRPVNLGDQIGVTGRYSEQFHRIQWPHIDATIFGIRRQFEPLITPLETASTGGIELLPEPKDDDMKFYNTYEAIAPSKTKVQRFYTYAEGTVEDVPAGQEASFKLLLGSSKRVSEISIARLRAQGARHIAK